ncbi:MAG: prenyltransferase/squalene oxidase repeat-containing protein [Planctomycetota bacterium]
MKAGAIVLVLAFAGVVLAEDAPHLARTMPPAGEVKVDEAVRGAVDFLVKNQNKDGSFGRAASAQPYQLWCQVPGGHMAFRGATTAICWMGLEGSPYQSEGSKKAQAKCLGWMVKNVRVKRAFAQQFYNVWSLGYGLRALARALETKAPGAKPEEIRATMNEIIKALDVYQSPDGGWGYLDFKVPAYKPSWSTSFTTATVMIGLKRAEEQGLEVPGRIIQKAVRLMWRLRTPDGNYVYSIDHKYYPHGLINRPGGSSLRNQTCNLALFLWNRGKMKKAQLRASLQRYVEQHRFAVAGMRRPRPHESWYAVSGYFYLYGQQYAADVLDHLDEADRRLYWPKVVQYTLKARQPDGSFWDYPTYDYHKYYGTGYALMVLARCPKPIAKAIDAKLKPKPPVAPKASK